MSKKRILGVIGLGHVGAHAAYALAVQGIADELVLVDQNEQKLASEVQDLRDAVAYLPHRVTVRAGGFADLGACDVIVNSVGKIDLLRGTHDRVTEMDFTIPAVRGYAEKIKASGFDGVLINITGSEDMGLEDVETAANLVQEAAHPDANIIFGASFDPSLDDEIRVSVIATGFDEPGKAQAEQAAAAPAQAPAAGLYTAAATAAKAAAPAAAPAAPATPAPAAAPAADAAAPAEEDPFDSIFKIFNSK